MQAMTSYASLGSTSMGILLRFCLVFLLAPSMSWAARAQHSAECDEPHCATEVPTTYTQKVFLTTADREELASLRPPLTRIIITSPYGVRFNPILRKRVLHAGVDYGSPTGTPVYAAQDGSVESAALQDHFGIVVRMRHSSTVETVYAHLHRLMPGLRSGSVLRRGDILGFVGASGFATGPHLHYEVIVNGSPIDPTSRNAGSTLHVVALK